jgi:arylsulfatase A-like enzyme
MKLLTRLALYYVFFLSCQALLLATERPNVVIILADDFGYGSAGCCGADGKLVQTPNIDRLAKEGRRFTDANTTSSVCSPTRYSVLTGRYCWRTSEKSGVLGTFSPLHIEPTRLNMASMLKGLGYRTAAIGKWHLGYGTATDSPKWRTDYTAELKPGPLEIGFDYHFGVPANHGDLTGVFVENRFVYGLRSGKIPAGMKVPGPDSDDANFKGTYTKEDTESGRATILELDAPRRVNERVMPQLTKKAVQWIEQQKAGTPFFLYYTPVAVHNPVTPENDLAGRSAAGPFGDWIHELDRSVGAVLDALDKRGLAKDTLVIFSSDNGGVNKPENPAMVQTQAIKAGLAVNGALRGGKHNVWEGGFKVPFLVRWPGKVPAGTVCHEMVSLADLLATTAAVVGEKLPAANVAAEDSYNILPAILGAAAAKPARDDMIVHSSDGVFAIRKGPWKWIEGVPVEGMKAGARKLHSAEFKPQLYNLRDDPAETKDVSAAQPEVVRELTALLTRYRDGAYSRELPPIVEKPKPVTVELPPLTGEIVLREPLDKLPAAPWAVTRGTWTPRDGALWGAQPRQDKAGATLRAPLGFTDGAIQYEVQFQGADRLSLRIETADRKGSFRIEISRTHLGITRNPAVGESKEEVEPLSRKPLQLEAGVWYPVRVSFRGQEATAQVGPISVQATDAILGQPKGAMNLLVFGEQAGFRKMTVAK